MKSSELVNRLIEAVKCENSATAELVALIAEVDARKVFLEHACSSTFRFCVERLGMSEGAAYKRIQVARVARRFPVLLTALGTGQVHLSGLAVLAAHLLGRLTSPSVAAVRAETRIQVERALNTMDDIDREVLALRHFEQLGNTEVAELLQISNTAASNRIDRPAIGSS